MVSGVSKANFSGFDLSLSGISCRAKSIRPSAAHWQVQCTLNHLRVHYQGQANPGQGMELTPVTYTHPHTHTHTTVLSHTERTPVTYTHPHTHTHTHIVAVLACMAPWVNSALTWWCADCFYITLKDFTQTRKKCNNTKTTLWFIW